jgi:adenylate cyclase
MPRWQLLPEQGAAIALPDDHAVVVGRGIDCAIRLEHDTISRQHAELRADAEGILLRDLGSSNGTRLNGVLIRHSRAAATDRVSFGALEFRVARGEREPNPRADPALPAAELPAGVLLHALEVRSGAALARVQAERLGSLVEVARQLSGEIELDRLLPTIVDQAAGLLPADRVALLLTEAGTGLLQLAHTSNRLGTARLEVPKSIVERAASERMPVVTESAVDDARFQSGSVLRHQVRAALAVPLLADETRVLGVLYVDSLTRSTPFSESDAALCFAFAGLAAVSIAKAHFAEAARREAVTRANFERFFAPGVAARIAAERSGARPGGERRAVTVLYSDLRGFTGLAESLPPEAVAEQLSEYFAAMVELVFEHGGTLDKFIGDALLALWGAPLASADDADRALVTARAMQRTVQEQNRAWAAAGRPELGVGIGLHHGEAFAGTIGSPRRLEYTVIGDVVNVAARLCDLAAAGEIVLSQQVHERLTGDAAGMPLRRDELTLKGRQDAVVAYRTGG